MAGEGKGNEKPDVIRETDDAARRQVRELIRAARHATLAVIEPETGYPAVSRTLIATDPWGVPFILVSKLSAHTAALDTDRRASLLFGEPGKGDPLAHPRLTLRCDAERIDRDSEEHASLRWRFLARHPKSSLYIDFADFGFFRFTPLAASLNGGFGKAYLLDGVELTIDSPAVRDLAVMEEGAVSHMNEDHADAIDHYARAFAGAPSGTWRMTDFDAEGFTIASGDLLRRIAFDPPLASASDLRPRLVEMARRARAIH